MAGREREFRALTDAVRHLIELTVTNVAPADETAAAAADLEAVAARLAATVPDPPLPRFMPTAAPAGSPLADHMPFDVVIGAYCPLALPVTITTEPPLAVGHARFGIAYEGPPGCVHGGVIAQVFDIMLSVANQLAGAAGPTAQLTVNYRRPTLLYRDTRIEAHVVKTEGRRTHSVGQVLQDGVVTAEAEGWFSALDRAEVIGLRHRRPST